jgi:AraC family transcriptional regulator, transcriptional activator of the genes for pyochelin and ferripyochelin receptors
MKKRQTTEGLMQAIALRPGLHLHIADFRPRKAAESRFESSTPLLRFYFHVAASGYWELRSPYRSASENTINHCDLFSSVLFYPELEGKICLPADHRQFHLSISVTQSVLREYLGDSIEQFPKNLQAISEGCNNRGFYHSGSLSTEMNAAIQQLVNSPYAGAMQRLYMESKAIELITHKLAQTALPGAKQSVLLRPHPDDFDRVHHAEEILRRNFESPPKLSDLARAVGTNHCALNKGFRKEFGATVFGHLRQIRLTEAKRLLEEEDMNVTEAALTVGYSSIPSFSRAFLEFFGENPMTCLKKK